MILFLGGYVIGVLSGVFILYYVLNTSEVYNLKETNDLF